MVTGAEVRAVARRNFEEARTKKPADLAATTTPQEAQAVEDNYEALMAAYLQTLIDGFEAASGNWDQLLSDAEQAEKDVTAAREGAQNIAETIEAMAKLGDAVTSLVSAVNS